MKSLLFAAFALSFILMVSAQCDVDAYNACIQRYADMVSKLHVALQLRTYICGGQCNSLHDVYIILYYF
jgi:hypothetical protein